jgi:hypothetical protein
MVVFWRQSAPRCPPWGGGRGLPRARQAMRGSRLLITAADCQFCYLVCSAPRLEKTRTPVRASSLLGASRQSACTCSTSESGMTAFLIGKVRSSWGCCHLLSHVTSYVCM